MTGHIYNAAWILVSERLWQALSPDDRDILLNCVRRSSRWQLDHMKQLGLGLEKQLREAGNLFTTPDRDAFRCAVEPAYEAIYEHLGPKASQARRIVEEIHRLREPAGP